MKIVSYGLEEGNKYYGTIDTERFYIGSRVVFEGRKGLMNIRGAAPQQYQRAQFRQDHGFWADFIHPTAIAEGGLYHALNTYDRAQFTFGFLQYAAHVPNGDFVAYLRQLLGLPLAQEYFPDLQLHQGRISRLTDAGVAPLESDLSTAPLLDYFNPSSSEVEDTEIIQAAKFIHWATHDGDHRAVQIKVGIAHFKAKMAAYAKQYGLDGCDDTICAAVADIRHQGRARSPEIFVALRSREPLKALLEIGQGKYPERLDTVRREFKTLLDEDIFGAWRYSLAERDFVRK